jgi:hypothetical protein
VAVKRLKFQRPRRPVPILPKGGLRRTGPDTEQETLTGEINGFKASAPEERAVRGAVKHPSVIDYTFRMTIGAERNMPGFKELDLLLETTNMFYAIEIDSAFTHRNKGTSDILHDALVLNALKNLNVYPQVIHLDQDADLATQTMADRTFKKLLG